MSGRWLIREPTVRWPSAAFGPILVLTVLPGFAVGRHRCSGLDGTSGLDDGCGLGACVATAVLARARAALVLRVANLPGVYPVPYYA